MIENGHTITSACHLGQCDEETCWRAWKARFENLKRDKLRLTFGWEHRPRQLCHKCAEPLPLSDYVAKTVEGLVHWPNCPEKK